MRPPSQDIFASVDARPAPAAYAEAARLLRETRSERRSVRVAILSSVTIDLLCPYLEVEAARGGMTAELYVAPFNTVHQELRANSGSLEHRPDVVFVVQLLSDACPSLVDSFLDLTAERVDDLISRVVDDTISSLGAFRERSNAAVVVHNFALTTHPAHGLREAMAGPHSQTEAIRRLNQRLATAAAEISGVYVLDWERACANVGYRAAVDDRMWHLARAPLSPSAMREIARVQAGFMRAIAGLTRKCLVLDLDNTLWGGVVGEVGRDGIALGAAAYPGSAFRQFQLTIRQLLRRGVLLAINSKNNPADALEVLQSHPDMVLRPSDFAAVRINWLDKPSNMVEIAKELNIGIDSMVFVDDDPAERAKMRQVLPEVLTLEMPGDPVFFPRFLLDSGAFDRLSFTEEDQRRGLMYQEQQARGRLEQSTASLEDFLRSLDMEIAIRTLDAPSFARAVDLIHKTNQFNLTSRRHSASVLRQFMEDDAHGVFTLRVSDRFGDNGIVGIAIVQLQKTTAMIDTLLLSCRVIGRTVETAFLAYLTDWARARGIEDLDGEFIATPKNAPAADFYRRHGFSRVSGSDVHSHWRARLVDGAVQWPPYIRAAQQVRQVV